MKPTLKPLILIVTGCLLVACKAQYMEQQKTRFEKGERAPAENFTGAVWVNSLVQPDDTFTTASGSVYFAKHARSNWHSHPAGQILIVTAGEGYHQIKGQPKERIQKGDVIKCPPNVEHWHGATEETAMTHLYIVPNTEKGIVNWKTPVTDIQFKN